MSMDISLQGQAEEAVRQMRRVGTDYSTVEAKAAGGGLPGRAKNSVAAFANTRGGLLLLGLSDPDFRPVQVDAAVLAGALASVCAESLEPPIRPEIEIVTIEGHQVVAALVEELPEAQKPCHVKAKGLEGGSYIRTHDGDRRLNRYEVHVLVSGRGQPRDDMARVEGATTDHLDPDAVAALLRRLRGRRASAFAGADDDSILRMMGVIVGDDEPGISLAGLLALGLYPQQFAPQLNVTFVAYPTVNGEPLDDGTRFLDNESLDGSIPEMVSGAMAAIRRNLTRRAMVTEAGRLDRLEYPAEVLRELVVNALMHRDYHPLAHGAQVRIELYPDRLEIVSPGGLHGAVDRRRLLAEPVTSSRNARLAKLLEDVEAAGSGRTVCENRGSGLLTVAAFLRKARLAPPRIEDDLNSLKVVIRNTVFLDADAVEWLSTLDTGQINERQRLCLAFLRANRRITRPQYRVITGCDSLNATQELVDMVNLGMIEKTYDQLWPTWGLSAGLKAGIPQAGRAPKESQTRGVANRRPRGRPKRRVERVAQIRGLLAGGPKPARRLAEELDLTHGAVMQWLRRMEEAGEVRPTELARRSPRNKWELTST